MQMRQLSFCVLAASLLGFWATTVVAVPTAHLPLSPSAVTPAVKAKQADAKTEKDTLTQKAEKAIKKRAEKKAIHNAEKSALRSFGK
jgi:hypothetical protein